MITISLPDGGPARAAAVAELYHQTQDLYEWAAREDNPYGEPRVPDAQRDQLDSVIGMALAWLEAAARPLAHPVDCPVCRGQRIDRRRDGSYAPGCPGCGYGRSEADRG